MSTMQDPPMAPADAEELRALIQALSQRMKELEVSHGVDPSHPKVEITDEKMATIANLIYQSRRRRAKLFASEMLGEPAWDMLLQLFIYRLRGKRINAGALCSAADISISTGRRWISMLEAHGLLAQEEVSNEAFLLHVQLTDEGESRMRSYLLEGIKKFEMPMPD